MDTPKTDIRTDSLTRYRYLPTASAADWSSPRETAALAWVFGAGGWSLSGKNDGGFWEVFGGGDGAYSGGGV